MNYKIEKYYFWELEKKITVPTFQRSLVWSQTEKRAFIETLRKGFPFGSILIYKYIGIDKYSLIDGLQRFTTIQDFREEPSKYINFEEFSEKIVKILAKTNDITESQESSFNKMIIDLIKDIVKLDSKGESVKPYQLFDKIKERLPQFPDHLQRAIIDVQEEIIKFSKNYLNINEVVIPCIEFIGDESQLAEVFENLNRGGKKLSKYQVFAAQWSNSKIVLNRENFSEKILNQVIERYNKLDESRKIKIEGFDEIVMRQDRTINLSEFCYALGVLVINTLDVFFKKELEEKENLANEIGFSTMGILMSVENNKLHKIINKKDFFKDSDSVEKLIEYTLSVYEVVNTNFSKFLILPGNTKKYQASVKTNFQIMSYFASLWIVKFDVNIGDSSIKINNNYSNDFNTITNNLIYYYINDTITRRWRGAGDSSLNSIYIDKNNRYLKSIDKDTLNNNLLIWHDDLTSKPSIKLEEISKTLLTINSSFQHNTLKGKSYDFEHIIAKNKLMNAKYKDLNISGGALGNIMFLESSLNRSKKSDNLHSYVKEGMKLDMDYLNAIDYPGKQLLTDIEIDLNRSQGEKPQNFINNRGKSIINSLINNLYKGY